MDTRAWRMGLGGRRLRWLEVDTGAVHRLKAQLLGDLEPRHDRRAAAADVTDGEQLEEALVAAGGRPAASSGGPAALRCHGSPGGVHAPWD
jgi:O-methyltransferase involved in polyketide biosynthesis